MKKAAPERFTLTALAPSSTERMFQRWRSPDRLQAYAVITLASFACYVLGRVLEGAAAMPFLMVGAGACGWAWLLTRALFDASRHDARWPRVVAAVIAIAGVLTIAGAADSAVARFAGNVYSLTGSAALLLTFVEPLNRYRRQLPLAERRFRFLFLAVYAVLVSIAVLGLRLSDAVPMREDLIKASCALAGLGAALAAVWFRLRHPHSRDQKPPSVTRLPTAEDARLADRLLALLRDEGIDAEPDLRIGEVAARLGQPEYKVSQCISTALGFPNFNRLINHHRIERARRLLADADRSRSILDIAFECGFGSVGPFNRAFKGEVGMTPRAFRAASRRLTDSSSVAQDDRESRR